MGGRRVAMATCIPTFSSCAVALGYDVGGSSLVFAKLIFALMEGKRQRALMVTGVLL